MIIDLNLGIHMEEEHLCLYDWLATTYLCSKHERLSFSGFRVEMMLTNKLCTAQS